MGLHVCARRSKRCCSEMEHVLQASTPPTPAQTTPRTEQDSRQKSQHCTAWLDFKGVIGLADKDPAAGTAATQLISWSVLVGMGSCARQVSGSGTQGG
jgi:hypothetical protein